MKRSLEGRIHFGKFELDLDTGELLRVGVLEDDRKTLLREQPFQVLRMLLVRGGGIVTREEIKRQLWPNDTTVDFDHSINVAIGVLRRALGDSANKPNYIETLGRRGYRLLVDVEPEKTATEIPRVEGADTQPVSTPMRAAGAATAAESAKRDASIAKSGNHRRNAVVLSAISLFLVVMCYAAWRRFLGGPPPKPEKIMLAVLPFQNLTGDFKQEYLADGLTEEMISQLARLYPQQLGVIARTSVMGYKHSDRRLDEIGRDLSVQYVLENSLRGSGDHLRVTVQLLQVKDQSHLWAHDYDYRSKDILGLEDDVAQAVAREIQIRLTPQQQANPTRVRTVNPEAFDAYMEGNFFIERDGDGDLNRAASYYEQAIRLDSSYAQSWVGLGRARFRQADRGLVPLNEGQQQAREAVEKALALDPNLAEAHAQLGQIKRLADWDWTGANASFQRALALDPENPAVLYSAASLAANLGHLGEALELGRQVIVLDPLNPARRIALAQLYCLTGHQKEAELEVKKALELNPNLPAAHALVSLVYLTQGRAEDALAVIQNEPMDVWRVQGQALAYHALGRKNDSEAALAELIAKYQDSWAFQIAEVYAFRKQPNQAFEWINRAYAQHDGEVANIKLSLLLMNLHADPRYAAFLQKLHLPV